MLWQQKGCQLPPEGREVEQPEKAHPICTTTGSYKVSQPLLERKSAILNVFRPKNPGRTSLLRVQTSAVGGATSAYEGSTDAANENPQLANSW